MIELNNVWKKYSNNVDALKNISLVIPDGEMVYLTGKSGSGKSSLLKLLYKQETATSGLVHVNNRDVTKLKKKDAYKLRREVGVVFQDFKLLPTFTVFENVAYVLEVLETPTEEIEQAVNQALQMVGLFHKKDNFPHQCSGGEQQRVSIARAICKNPKLILADEPTGNLDPHLAEDIMRLFHRINKTGTTVIIATHNWDIIEKYPYRVITMKNGELISDRSKNHISILVSEDFHDGFQEVAYI